MLPLHLDLGLANGDASPASFASPDPALPPMVSPTSAAGVAKACCLWPASYCQPLTQEPSLVSCTLPVLHTSRPSASS